MRYKKRCLKAVKQIIANGSEIGYQDRGQGEPLVLVMGLGASSLKWGPHILCYEKHFRVLAIDNRGSGYSAKPECEVYSIADMAADVIGLLEALGIARAHVNGISMGGAVAQYLAIHYPERVKSVILTNTFPRCSVSFRRCIEILRDSIDQLNGRTFGRLAQWMIFSSTFQDSNEAYLLDAEANDADAANPMPAYAYKAQCNAILGFDESANLGRIKAPVLVVAGDHDLLATVPVVMEMVNAIPDCRLHMVKNGGHVQHWEDLEGYNRVTLDFLLEQAK